MTRPIIPDIVVSRLPLYLRAISRMEEEGLEYVSSHELGARLGISAAQIRKDLSQFGEFGKQGTGYHIPFLKKQLIRILKVDRVWDVAVIGAGDVGSALARYQGFQEHGFRVAMLFDSDPAKIGKVINGIEVRDVADMERLIAEGSIQVAMLAVPAEVAQETADKLIAVGVRAILNYAPVNLAVREGIRVEHIDPVIHLQHMTYYLAPR